MRCFVSMSLLVLLTTGALSQGSSYQVKSGDQLQISFWENPELNTTVTVGKDGGIEVPIIGRIAASGLSIDQLREKIISQMALYNKLITQLSVVVLDYGSNSVFVTGQVRTPGRYSFEEIPNLWDIILHAGGHLETALLDEVTIVRKQDNGQVFKVNISKALREGKLNTLPEIYPGDTIHVPGTTMTGNVPSPLAQKSEIYIMGAVGVPGAHKFESGLNLVEAIGRAGGPNAEADLENVQFIARGEGAISKVQEFNLEGYFHQSQRHPVQVKAGDTIYVPWRKQMSPIARAAIQTLITSSITTAIVLLIR